MEHPLVTFTYCIPPNGEPLSRQIWLYDDAAVERFRQTLYDRAANKEFELLSFTVEHFPGPRVGLHPD
jgi:hypothetical protein